MHYSYFLFYLISFPKGINDNFASLKHCAANGIPTIVTHNKTALTKLPIHNAKPPNNNHNIFNSRFPALSLTVTTSLPKGANCKLAILKHCNPTGIPTIVKHQSNPANNQPNALKNPPNIIHIIFPKQDRKSVV